MAIYAQPKISAQKFAQLKLGYFNQLTPIRDRSEKHCVSYLEER